MGQKVSPVGLRVGIIRDWDSRWYADKNQVKDLLVEDIQIRKFLNEKYKNAAISRITIERLKGTNKDRVKITLHTAKPGVVIGREGETKNQVVKTLAYKTKKDVVLNVLQVENPECDAVLVAKSMAEQLENRASFRRVQKVAIQRALKNGAKGAKTLISGRLGGAEMARCEGYAEGQVPLHTLRADIDYAHAEADTTYGKLGIKVWIYRGEILPTKNGFQAEELKKDQKRNDRRNNNRKPYNKNEEGKDGSEGSKVNKPRAKKPVVKENTNEGGN